jgi:chromosomal replication initiation ATPase DnaA
MPLLLSPELERRVAALPAALRDLAHGLHMLMTDDDRTWLEVLVAAVAAEVGADLEAVLAGDRRRPNAGARHAGWHAIRAGTNGRASLPDIGKAFGGMHHTTVLSGLRKHERRLAGDRFVAEAVERYQAGQAGQAGQVGHGGQAGQAVADEKDRAA